MFGAGGDVKAIAFGAGYRQARVEADSATRLRLSVSTKFHCGVNKPV